MAAGAGAGAGEEIGRRPLQPSPLGALKRCHLRRTCCHHRQRSSSLAGTAHQVASNRSPLRKTRQGSGLDRRSDPCGSQADRANLRTMAPRPSHQTTHPSRRVLLRTMAPRPSHQTTHPSPRVLLPPRSRSGAQGSSGGGSSRVKRLRSRRSQRHSAFWWRYRRALSRDSRFECSCVTHRSSSPAPLLSSPASRSRWT